MLNMISLIFFFEFIENIQNNYFKRKPYIGCSIFYFKHLWLGVSDEVTLKKNLVEVNPQS